MPRYVVLRHEMAGSDRPLHWDLMLESNGVLWTWALPEFPKSGLTTFAERLPDHRLAYLEYEGPISGNRGNVQRIMRGDYRLLHAGEDGVELVVESGDLQGGVTLTRMDDGQRWKVTLADGK